MSFRVGETVRIPKGAECYVLDVRSFLDELAIRDEEEAKMFVEQVRASHGPEFRTRYCRVLVQAGAVMKWFDGKDLVLVASRGEFDGRSSEVGGASSSSGEETG